MKVAQLMLGVKTITLEFVKVPSPETVALLTGVFEIQDCKIFKTMLEGTITWIVQRCDGRVIDSELLENLDESFSPRLRLQPC